MPSLLRTRYRTLSCPPDLASLSYLSGLHTDWQDDHTIHGDPSDPDSDTDSDHSSSSDSTSTVNSDHRTSSSLSSAPSKGITTPPFIPGVTNALRRDPTPLYINPWFTAGQIALDPLLRHAIRLNPGHPTFQPSAGLTSPKRSTLTPFSGSYAPALREFWAARPAASPPTLKKPKGEPSPQPRCIPVPIPFQSQPQAHPQKTDQAEYMRNPDPEPIMSPPRTAAPALAPDQVDSGAQAPGSGPGTESTPAPTSTSTSEQQPQRDPRDSTTHHSTSDRPTNYNHQGRSNYQPAYTYSHDPATRFQRRGGQQPGIYTHSSPVSIPSLDSHNHS